MKSALVTGGAGFIGSHLVDALIAEGWSVKVLDDLSAGTIYNIPARPNLNFHPGTLLDRKTVDEVCWGVDAIFHLAARCDIRKSLVDHFTDLDNVTGTLNLLESARENGIPDFILTSTSAIYGEASVTPTPEDYVGVQESLYSASKLSAELFAQAFTRLSGMKVWVFRFANPIGTRCRRGVVWDFVHKLADNPRQLEILGDGKQSKQYFHVSDCITGMMTGYKKSSDKVNVFNISTDEDTTVDQVADYVTEALKIENVKRIYTGARRGWIGDLPVVKLSTAKLRALGWSPKVQSKDAVTEEALWARSQP